MRMRMGMVKGMDRRFTVHTHIVSDLLADPAWAWSMEGSREESRTW